MTVSEICKAAEPPLGFPIKVCIVFNDGHVVNGNKLDFAYPSSNEEWGVSDEEVVTFTMWFNDSDIDDRHEVLKLYTYDVGL